MNFRYYYYYVIKRTLYLFILSYNIYSQRLYTGFQGRQSGSEEWRTQRGEIGEQGGACAIPVIPIIKPAQRPLPIHRQRIFNLDPTKVSLVGAARFSGSSVRILILPSHSFFLFSSPYSSLVTSTHITFFSSPPLPSSLLLPDHKKTLHQRRMYRREECT